jgi:lysophospholipase L1-like esterase
MLLKVAIAILLAFVIAVPLTFWLLKKVRIKAKVRHVQVSLALGLPAALFVYLLQTSIAVPVVVITVAFSLLVVALELTLRRLIAKLPAARIGLDNGVIGSGVAFEEARAAAGAYPDDYMTKNLWLEMQEFMKSRSSQKSNFKAKNVSGLPVDSFKMHAGIDFQSPNYVMRQGVRNTTDVPPFSSGKTLFLLGASIILCEEVPDRLTGASFLQRLINPISGSFQVANYGASGATTIDRTKLSRLISIEPGDIVIFYFGGADAGWIDRRSGKESRQLVWLPIRALRALSELGIETARWLSIELLPLSLRKYSRLAVSETLNAMNSANEYCVSRGVQMIAVLSPNLYTLRTKSQYERQLEKRFSIDMRNLVLDAYRRYEEWVNKTPYAVSATHIFDNSPAPVFLDWAHVNARGNELIAIFIFEELKKRKLISVDEEV